MRRCRLLGGSHAVIVVVATSLLACANIAGLDDEGSSPTSKQGGKNDPQESNATSANPSDKALGGSESESKERTPGDISVAVTELDFAAVVCGTQSRAQKVVIENKGDTERSFALNIPAGAPFGLDPGEPTPPSKIAPRGSVTLSIVANPIIFGVVKSNLVIESQGSFVTIPVGVKGAGAVLEWPTQLADIGETPLGTDGLATITLKNTGTARASISKLDTSNNAFTATPSANFQIEPGDEKPITFKLVKGNSVSGKLTGTFTPTGFGWCQPPTSIATTGQRVDTSVTVTGADWGRQPCNSTLAASQAQRSVVVKNYYTKPVKWTLKTTSLSKYALASGAPTSGTVAAANGSTPSQVAIPFVAPPYGQSLGQLAEDVTITLENPEGITLPATALGDRKVSLRSDVRGAIVSVSRNAIDFTAALKKTDREDVTITNSGNEAANIDWTFARTAGEPAWTGLPGTTYTSGSNGTTLVRIGYTPSSAPPNAATLTPGTNGGYKICNLDSLGKITMTGKEPESAPPPDAGN